MRNLGRITALTLVFALLATGSAGAAVNFSSSVVTNNILAASANPETDGAWIVYENESLIMGSTRSINARNRHTNEFVVIADDVDLSTPDISMNRVAYQSSTASGDIRLYDLGDDTDVAVAASADVESEPRISGEHVIWFNDTDNALWYKNLKTGTSDTIVAPANITSYDIDKGRVVYVVDNDLVYTIRPDLDTVATLVWNYSSDDVVTSVKIHGDLILMSYFSSGDPRMRRYNVSSGTSFGSNAGGNAAPRSGNLFHNSVAWESGPLPSFDISFEQTMTDGASPADPVATSVADEGDLSIFGRRIVWEQSTGVGDIYVATATPEAVRTAGADRYETAAAASKAYFGSANSAVLCTGLNFPDALAAAPFAKIAAAPLLLSRKDSVPQATLDELERLEATNVFVVGGEAVLTDAVVDQLETAGYTTERIPGATRYDTANRIAARIVDAGSSDGTWDGTAFFVRGDTFPDALAVGPVAAQAGAPIFLVKSTEIPTVVHDAITNLNIKQGFVVGGENAVSIAVRDEIETILTANGGPGDPTERWSGADRYATAAEVIDRAMGYRYIDLDTLGLATGENFPDALGGGAALGYYGSGLALTPGSGSIHPGLQHVLDEQHYAIGRLNVFGGTGVISNEIMTGVTTRLIQ